MHNLLTEKLNELNNRYGASGLKIEFETGDIDLAELEEVRNISSAAGLRLVIKIGGCGAVRDILDAKNFKADTIVAPMIESVYALKKFVKSVDDVYADENFIPDLYINIETENGVKEFDNIIQSPDFKKIHGVVIGRNDLSKSLGISSVDDDFIKNTVHSIANKTFDFGKDVIIGGKITTETHFSEFPIYAKFETRKIIFNCTPVSEGILKALEFEILFIAHKKNKNSLDKQRLAELTKRINRITSIATAGGV